MQIIYSNHAVKQMFQRSIFTTEVEFVLQHGEIINDYPGDKPYPSRLMFAFYGGRPLHVVCGFNLKEDVSIVITVYEPTSEFWEDDFVTRKIL